MSAAFPPTARQMLRPLLAAAMAAAVLGGCASRAVDVRPQSTNPGEFADWS